MTPQEKYALVIIGVIWLAAIGTGLGWLAYEAFRLRRLVFVNLDAAYANGYFEPGEQLYGMTSDDIAHDMTCYAVDFEDTDAATLAPHVWSWRCERGLV